MNQLRFLIFIIIFKISIISLRAENFPLTVVTKRADCKTCYIMDPKLPFIYEVKYSKLPSGECDENASKKKALPYPSGGKLMQCASKSCGLPGTSCKSTDECCSKSDITEMYSNSNGAPTSGRKIKSASCVLGKCQISPCVPEKKCKTATCYAQSPDTKSVYRAYYIHTCQGCYTQHNGKQDDLYNYTALGLEFPGGIVLQRRPKDSTCEYCSVPGGVCKLDKDCCVPKKELIHTSYDGTSPAYGYEKYNRFKVEKVSCVKNKCTINNCLNGGAPCSSSSSLKCCQSMEMGKKPRFCGYRDLGFPNEVCTTDVTAKPRCEQGKEITFGCYGYHLSPEKGGGFCNCYPPKSCVEGKCKKCKQVGDPCKNDWRECCPIRLGINLADFNVECREGKCAYCINNKSQGCDKYPCCKRNRKKNRVCSHINTCETILPSTAG